VILKASYTTRWDTIVAEADSGTFGAAMGYPTIRCNPCGSQAGLQSQQIKQIINGWARSSHGRRR